MAKLMLLRNGAAASMTSTISGADGGFAFANVEPGSYRVLVNAGDYLPGEFGAPSISGIGDGTAVDIPRQTGMPLRIVIRDVPEGYHVREINFDGRSVLNQSARIGGRRTGSVPVDLRSNAATIRGSLDGPGTVVLIPNNRERIDSSKRLSKLLLMESKFWLIEAPLPKRDCS
jgi:hypothetical protein